MNILRAIALLAASASIATAQPIAGLWDGTVMVNGVALPFRVQFSGAGAASKAWFFNGDERIISTSADFAPAAVNAHFDQYNSRLELTLKNGALEGAYTRDGKVYPVRAIPFHKPAPPSVRVPDIAGSWLIETGADKGERAWRLLVHQSGPDVSGSVLRVDGDTGTLTGRFENGRFVMSHFSGARPSLFELTPRPDGSLDVLFNSKQKYTAVRAQLALEKGLPPPDDPIRHTTLKNPAEPLQYRFPDLAGNMVANTDPRFKGKVVILTLGGSWCPNCHDEAPLLEDLYRKYHSRGLEIVELSFEEEEQLKNPARLRAFRKEYGLDYIVLLAGEPSQLAEKLPQAVNLDTFPATFFIGRDGLVKAIHAGFAGKATGALHAELVTEIESTVKKLLAAR